MPGAKKLFNAIAPIYSLFFSFQVRYYQRLLNKVKQLYDLSRYKHIIDVGCGTGALCYALHTRGLKVTGIDRAEKMLALAAKRLAHTDVQLVCTNAHQPTPFPDKSFEVAISCYTAHGMAGHERKKFYQEMNRLANYEVIIHDFNSNRALLIDLIEKLEGSDYHNFIYSAKQELLAVFKEVAVINVGAFTSWYICTPY